MYSFLLFFIIYNVNCECHNDQFTCADGKCILQNWICDGARDCSDGSDETHEACDKHKSKNSPCFGNQPECKKHGSFRCIPHEWLCDGHPDCDSGEDENNCTEVEWFRRPESLIENYRRTFSTSTADSNYCDYGHFKCNSTSQCVQRDKLCDKIKDCADGSDEEPRVCGTINAKEELKVTSEVNSPQVIESTTTPSLTTTKSSTPITTTTLDNDMTSQELRSIITSTIPPIQKTTKPEEDAVPPYLRKAIQPPVRVTTESVIATTSTVPIMIITRATPLAETTTKPLQTTTFLRTTGLRVTSTNLLAKVEQTTSMKLAAKIEEITSINQQTESPKITTKTLIPQNSSRDSPLTFSVNSSLVSKKPVKFYKGIPIKPINITDSS